MGYFYDAWVQCDSCYGRGTDKERCPECDGLGKVWYESRGKYVPCIECGSTGEKTVVCRECDGDGRIKVH